MELSSTNGWKAHFTDLPETKADGTTPIAYTVEEKPVPGYDSKVTGNATDGFTVTNTKKDEPVVTPTDEPTGEPTTGPTTEPTSEPTTGPTSEPTDELTTEPSGEPTASAAVTSAPTAGPGSAIRTARL